jgi:hypothetical protein
MAAGVALANEDDQRRFGKLNKQTLGQMGMGRFQCSSFAVNLNPKIARPTSHDEDLRPCHGLSLQLFANATIAAPRAAA